MGTGGDGEAVTEEARGEGVMEGGGGGEGQGVGGVAGEGHEGGAVGGGATHRTHARMHTPTTTPTHTSTHPHTTTYRSMSTCTNTMTADAPTVTGTAATPRRAARAQGRRRGWGQKMWRGFCSLVFCVSFFVFFKACMGLWAFVRVWSLIP